MNCLTYGTKNIGTPVNWTKSFSVYEIFGVKNRYPFATDKEGDKLQTIRKKEVFTKIPLKGDKPCEILEKILAAEVDNCFPAPRLRMVLKMMLFTVPRAKDKLFSLPKSFVLHQIT